MKGKVMLLMALFVSVLAIQSQPPPSAIAVAVSVEQTAGPEGFVEPVPKLWADAAAELIKQLRKYRGLATVPQDRDSDVRIVLSGVRFDTEQTGGAVAFPIGSMVVAVPTRASWATLRMILTAGDYRKEIITTGNSWKKAVEASAKEIVAWLNANHAQLLSRRGK